MLPGPPKVVATEDEKDDVPDIEYMPPKPTRMFTNTPSALPLPTNLITIPRLTYLCLTKLFPTALPDPPEDIPYNTDFPQFKGKNRTRGWHKLFVDEEVGEDGLTRKQREIKAEQEAYDKRMDALIQEQVDNMELLGINVRQFPDEPCAEEVAAEIMRKREQKQQPAKRVIVDRSISTVRSRNAARMLSHQSRPTVAPPVPKPKPKPKPKVRFSSGFSRPKKPQQQTPSNPSTMRHAAATASSRTTVGYSKGRRLSANLRQKAATTNKKQQRQSSMNQEGPASNNPADILSPERYMELYGSPPFGSEMWSRCKAAGLFDSAFERVESEEEVPLFPMEDEEAENFQLTL